ncbi:TonB-dependent receptor [Sphingobium sp. B11D3A]|uniref:TonB-dependent receptor n=1 Tax=Sphingobium sp. B11D3A TaxID=2940574 RepID=UPI00222451D2|nr:TonB-dependent receptor [Sphingobium sp. B11D3A]MCW2393534.1 outer membrane receptor protein involved in Fe transport [Sphingobium sp. B11D3A]
MAGSFIVLWGLGLSTEALADSPPSNTESNQIVVTGSLSDAPNEDKTASLRILTGQQLEANNISSMFDLPSVLPSLRTPSSGAPAEGASFRLRGFGSPVFQLGIEPAVTTFVDEVYRSRSGMVAGNLFDIEQVEIHSGPVGTKSGTSATAGAVQILTKKPKLGTWEGRADAELGSYRRATIQMALNAPLSSTVAARFTGYRSKGDGLVGDFWQPSRRHNDLNRYGLRVQVRIVPSPNFTLDLAADMGRTAEHCCATVRLNRYVTPFETVIAKTNVAPEPARLQTLMSDLQRSSVRDRGAASTANLNVLPNVVLTSISSYRRFGSHTLAEGDFTGAMLASIDTTITSEIFTQELRLSRMADLEDGPRGSSWRLGAFFRSERISRLRQYDWGADTRRFFPPVLSPAVGRGASDDLVQKAKSFAIFGNIDVPLARSIQLNAGGRIDVDRKFARGVFDQSVLIVLPRVNPRFEARTHTVVPSWTVGISHHHSDTLSTYFSYARGYKAGGINLAREASGLIGAAANPGFDPETVDHVELGAKGQILRNKLSFSAAFFLDQYHRVQNQIFAPPVFFVTNGAGALIKGFELTGEFSLVTGLAISGDITHLHTRFDRGTDLGNGDVGGAALGWAPRWSGSVGADLNFPIDKKWRGFGSMRLMLSSSYRASVNVNPFSGVNATQLLTARFGLARKGARLSIWCKNCLDERYAEVILPNPIDSRAFESYQGQQRQMGAAIALTF